MRKEVDDTRIKDVKNLFRLKKEIYENTFKDVTNLARLNKENKEIKDRINGDFRYIFQHHEEGNKLVSAGNFFSDNFIEYEINGDRNKALSIEKYLNKIRPSLKDSQQIISINLIHGKLI